MDARVKSAFAAGLLAAAALSVSAGTRISQFFATRDRNAVVLEWTTEEESNLARFEIERSTDRVRWFRIGEVRAAGESARRNTYTFRDQTIFKTAANSLSYRLVLVDMQGNSLPYDVIASVEGQSGIRHTWGSIKAMFR
jgi:hypothetical protein